MMQRFWGDKVNN